MKSYIQKLPQSQIELKVELSGEEFQGFVQEALLGLGSQLEVKGFRRGQAPKEIIEKEIPRPRVFEEAAHYAIQKNYAQAILDNKIEPLGDPEIEILKMPKPEEEGQFEFKAKISVLPEIKLPDYRQIASRVQTKEVSVSKEEIEKLKEEKQRLEKEKMRGEIVEKIVQDAEIEIPEILIDSEKRHMLEDLKQQVSQMLRIGFQDYLAKINKTEKELLDSFAAEAPKRIKAFLILREIEKKENIEVSEEELSQEIDRTLQMYPEAQKLDPPKLKEYTENVIKNEKTLKFLEKLAEH